jgi:dihydrolipoamide dehydrogenase
MPGPQEAPTHTVDVAIIGAGTAGLAAYRAAIAAGKRTLVIEAGDYGTTCARVGCMPSKLLLAAAEAAYHARHARPFGVYADVRVDGRDVMDRVRRERDRFVGFVVDGIDKIPPADKLRGHARFVSPGVLAASASRVAAGSIVIATGSSPFIPPMFQGLGDRLVVNDDVFMWKELPESVAVFGAGVIGLELGQALARLGVRVHVFGRNGGVGGITDPKVKAAALAAFRRELPIDPDAKVLGVARGERDDKGVVVRFEDDAGKEVTESFAYALVAAGRRPNLKGLGLENAGIPLRASGAPLYDPTTLQCGDTSVFIGGDASDDVPLLHEAADEGKIAGENAARFPNVRPGLRRSLLAIVFTDPQIAVVGTRFQDLPADVVIGEVSFEDQGRARVMLQNVGLLRVYADPKTGRFLGAELAGPRAENLGHLLAWAHQEGLTIERMLTMPFYHPVIEEGLRTALRDAQSKLERNHS